MKVQNATDQIHGRAVSVALGPGSQPRAVPTTSSQCGWGMSNPSGTFGKVWRYFYLSQLGGRRKLGATRIRWAMVRDAAQHPAMHRTAYPLLAAKNYLVPNFSNAERLRNWALNWTSEGKTPMNKDPVNDSVYGLSAPTIRLPPGYQEEI